MEPPNTRPCFIPADLDFDSLPDDVQVAVQQIVTPAYEELVLQASDALERATAFSFVHALYLEVLNQHEMGKQVSGELGDAAVRTPRDGDLERHFRLLSAKDKAGKFLLQVRRLRERYPSPKAEWTPPHTAK